MYSFYGGKQGRTYNIVERYDLIYIDLSLNNKWSEDNPNGLKDFIDGSSYNVGDRILYEGTVYLVLPQLKNSLDNEELSSGSEITTLIEITNADLKNNNHVVVIKGMVNEFQKGGAYTDANYGLYVIIDTILNLNHKNDDINGIIYRRGFDYTEPASSYQRPHKDDKATRTFSESGDVEFLDLYVYHDYEVEHNGTDTLGNDVWNVIDKGFNTNRWVAAWRKYILKPGGGAIYVGQIVGPQGDSPEIIGLKWSEFLEKDNGKNIQMEPTPGLDVKINPDTEIKEFIYNDHIQTGYCTIKDQDGNVTGAYLSFNIPLTIFKFSAQSVSPYGDLRSHLGELRSHYDEASKKTDNITFTAIQDRDTGEWKYTNLINQHSLTGFLGEHPFYYNFDIAIPKGIHGQDIISMQIEKGKAIVNPPMGIEVVDDDEYITYYTKNYNNSSEGNISKPQGIWPYRVIDKISINKKERSRFAQNSSAKIGDLYIPDESNNIVAVCIQAGTTVGQLEFNPIESELGKIINSGTSSWRVVRIPSTAAAALLLIDYKAGESDTPSTRLLDYLTVDSAGNIYASYSDSNLLYYLTNIGGVENIFISNEKNITQAQYWAVKYQGRNSSVNVSNPLNRLLAIDRQGDNIIALYSDPGYREALTGVGKTEGVDYYKKEWKENPSLGKLVWENLGSIGGGVHIEGEYTLADLKRGGQLENGLAGDRAGWVVTVKQGNNYYLYAYDNHNDNHDLDGENSHWYVIKDIGANLITPVHSIRVSSESSGSMYQVDQLNENGLWFVVSDGHAHN